MTTIAIKLSPVELRNPDMDIRHEIPSRLSEASGGEIVDDGFDYLADQSMIIFLSTSSDDSISTMMRVLADEQFFGNRILDSALIGVDTGSGFSVIHPEGYDGDFSVEDG